MRVFVSGLALLAVVCVMITSADAGGDKDKEAKLKGKITCAKCDLGVAKACATVIVVKKDKKDVTIYFDAASNKKYHGDICTEAKNGSVTGTLKKDGDKQVISVKSLKYE